MQAHSIAIEFGQGARRSAPEWPVVVGSIPPRADCFQDRPEAQEKLVRAGAVGRAAVIAQPVSVVSGLGGVGKTQLAGAYARHLLHTKAVDVLVWAPAGTRAGIVARYAQATEGLGLGGGDDLEAACERFLGWLATTDRPWLVVLDDLTAADGMRGLWPPDHRPAGRTVATTRRRDATLLAGRELVDLDVFTSQEANAYLCERLPATLADDTDGVAANLGYLPLALAHAAAFMLDTDLPCTSYREMFEDRRRRLTEMFPHPTTLFDDTTATVATTWSMSIEQANQLPPADVSGRVLELASMLDPNGIPVTVFATSPALNFLTDQTRHVPIRRGWLDHPRHDPTGGFDDDAVRAGLANLRRFNLITVTGPVARVHALVQRAVRDNLAEADAASVIRAAADAVLEAWPDIERDTSLTTLMRGNVAVLADRTEADALWTPAAGGHPLLFRAVRSLGEAGLLTAAIAAAKQLNQQAERRLGADHLDTLATRAHLAQWRGVAGDVVGAVEALESLLPDQVRVLGVDHPHTLSTRGNLARWRGLAGDPIGAVEAFEQLLPDLERVLGADHLDTLATRGNLARGRGVAGDVVGAVEALESLLPDQVRVLGVDHPHTLATRCNVARWRGRTGDPAVAVEALEQLLPDLERALGADHLDTMTARNNLATLRGEAGDLVGAVEAFEQLLLDRLRVVGEDHPHTLATRGNLARWRGLAGDPIGAVEAFEELLPDLERVLGADHLYTLTARNNLASLRAKAGDLVGAVEAFEQLLLDRLRVLGTDHPYTMTTRGNLAGAQGLAGDPVGAVEALEKLLPHLERALGTDHLDTLTARNNLASLRGKAGDVAGAVEAFDRLLPDLERLLGTDHPHTLTARNNQASLQGQAGATAG